VEKEVEGSGSGSCPVVAVGVSSVEISVSATADLCVRPIPDTVYGAWVSQDSEGVCVDLFGL
jgi:hypothetical protein